MKNKELNYEAPVIEILNVEVEKGFATSGSEGEIPGWQDGGNL